MPSICARDGLRRTAKDAWVRQSRSLEELVHEILEKKAHRNDIGHGVWGGSDRSDQLVHMNPEKLVLHELTRRQVHEQLAEADRARTPVGDLFARAFALGNQVAPRDGVAAYHEEAFLHVERELRDALTKLQRFNAEIRETLSKSVKT